MTTTALFNPLPNGEDELSVSFSYIDREYVKVYKRLHADGIDQIVFDGTLLADGVDYTWVDDGTIQLTTPADGLTDYLVKRVTTLNPIVTQQPTSLSSSKINLADRQSLNVAEEAISAADDAASRAEVISGRTLRVPDGETVLALPSAAARANKYLSFLPDGTILMSEGTGADAGLRGDLGAASGAAMLGLQQGGYAQDAIKYITPEMFGAVGDFDPDTGTGTPDTAAFNLMKAWLAANGGGEVQLSRKYLIGGFVLDVENVVLRGLNNNCGFGVEDGTLGVLISASYSYPTNLTYWSQSGDPEDGLNTRGEVYSKGVSNQSIGHMNPCNVIFKNFSGVPRECVNLVHADFGPALFILCKRGPVVSKGGAGGADFSTTVNFSNQYVLDCGDGGTITGLQGAHYDVILQGNVTPMVVNGGRFTCSLWAEGNVAGAITTNDAFVNFTEISTKAGNNSIVRNWTGLVTAAADRGYRDFSNFDVTAKHFNVLSLYGVDPKPLAGIGTSATIGLKFNEAVIPTIYGDDLLDPEAWASDGTSEFVGWDVVNRGYKIATALTGVRGMKQSVSLNSAKTYVIQFLNKNVLGNPVSSLQVDGVAVTPGIPFTVATTGTKVVRCYGSQTVTSENYVQVFRLMEVLEDQTQMAKSTDRLLRSPGQRAERYATAAPTSGYHALAERTWNSNPASGQPAGWITTTAASPGTALPFGLIGLTKGANAYTATNVTTDRTFDANATTLDELADVVGTLLADLKVMGLLP